MRYLAATLCLIAIIFLFGCEDHHDPVNPEHPRGHFGDLHPTASFHTLMIVRVTEGRDTIPTGSEVGVYTPIGELAGYGQWTKGDTLRLIAYGSDPDDELFYNGDYFVFRVWNATTGEEKFAEANFYSEFSSTWQAFGISYLILDLFDTVEQTISLTHRNQLISINVDPLPETFIPRGLNCGKPDVKRLIATIAARTVLVKSDHGFFYAPQVAGGFNNIPFWNTASGYLVTVDSGQTPVTLRVAGKSISAFRTMSLAGGWNYIGYFPNYRLSCQAPNFTAISHAADNAYAKDAEGNFALPHWGFSNMPYWEPGKGYALNLRAGEAFSYPSPEASLPPLPIPDTLSNRSPFRILPSTGESMNLLITSLRGVTFDPSDAMAAFSSDGVQVGFGRPVGQQIGLVIWGDDPTSTQLDGLREGDAFTLKYWSSQQDSTFGILLQRIETGRGLVYHLDELTVASAI